MDGYVLLIKTEIWVWWMLMNDLILLSTAQLLCNNYKYPTNSSRQNMNSIQFLIVSSLHTISIGSAW